MPRNTVRFVCAVLLTAKTAAAQDPTESSGPAAARRRSAPIPTAAAGEAGLGAQRGAISADLLARWKALLESHKGPELARELEKHLVAPDPLAERGSFAVLHDFLRHLDDDPRLGRLLVADYRIAFSMMHLVMLHEEELARFAHYYLAASWDARLGGTGMLVYDYLPLFLEYHAGRFPDLEQALRRSVSEKLASGQENIAVLFAAMKFLRYVPDIDVVRALLDKADSLHDATVLVDHLADRDDRPATVAVNDFLRKQQDFNSSLAAVALGALARMKNDDAQKAIAFYLSGRNRQSVEPALRAYFSLPRLPGDAVELRAWLGSSADEARKVSLLGALRRNNREVLQALARDIDPSWPAKVQSFLRAQIEPAPPTGARSRQKS
jgi:hypothetical protein